MLVVHSTYLLLCCEEHVFLGESGDFRGRGTMAVCAKCSVAELVYWISAARGCHAAHPRVQPCPWGHQAPAAPISPKPVFSQYSRFYVTRIS